MSETDAELAHGVLALVGVRRHPARGCIEHIWYSLLGVGIAALIALPIGLLIGHTGRGSLFAATLSNFWRALPTLGVVTLVFRLQPLSVWPVIVALVAIAVPPILLEHRRRDPLDRRVGPRRGTRHGHDRLAGAVEGRGPAGDAADRGGLPLRRGQVIATATIAAYVGLGGLGRFIIDGYSNRDLGQITGGAVMVAVVALTVEGGFALLRTLPGPEEGAAPQARRRARRSKRGGTRMRKGIWLLVTACLTLPVAACGGGDELKSRRVEFGR